MSILYIQSHSGGPGAGVARAAQAGDVAIVRERELTPDQIEAADGLITTTHLDQIGWLAYAVPVQRLLARGGRWVFNGHILRPFLPGLAVYMPLLAPKREDLALTRLGEHPIFAGIDQQLLAKNRGVAGFYGRGHNPMPPGATAINGLGPGHLPIDWHWRLPTGGEMLVHAGNEFWGCGDDAELKDLLVYRTIAWTGGRL
ncbi:MAG: hypothetical protein BGO82_11445 [Devosia sp. 67-54]|uniref:hypothetical protein n=1 Tax=unclassified Devosia TaxID=196773 RepID=UPI00086B3D06|nr:MULTISPECIES: hypothetical protein [unclassified Devosia]MBN9304745.1 hypothetical protein [Devosia sp.]ODU56472.1 MAG: hypothetical protein ABS99_05870 [Acetobacteraceae bacterium SCN 69-10]OJX15285.1 MAG: hypothetical protein BGO82_11445 [Devosia sp. 67-54]